MPNASTQQRARRLAETIRRLLAGWQDDLPDDRRLSGLVTFTEVRVSGDLQHAKVWFTVLGEDHEREAALAELRERTTEARTWVAHRLRGVRVAPSLEFLEDDVALRGARIDRLLAELGQPDDADAEAAADDTQDERPG
jgi:ribosome-binding factor A